MSESSPSPTTSDESGKQRAPASKALRVLTLVLSTVAGLVAAFVVLRMGRPFDDRSDHLTWIGTAIATSIVVSLLASSLLTRLSPIARAFDTSAEFESELQSRFKTSLRAGNTKTLLRTGEFDLTKEEQAEHVLRLLDRITRHDRATRGHSERVRAYSTLIGEELSLSPTQLRRLTWASVLHDVGKLDVPATILSHPDNPSKAQWAVLKRHPSYAHPYLQPIEGLLGEDIYHAAAFHHERWDGSGYPRGIGGSDIPLVGRIVAVADAFDVMTHARSYKKPYSLAHAKEELERGAGTQFDPTVVAAFLRIGEGSLRKIRGFAGALGGLGAAAESAFAAQGAQVLVTAAAAASAIFVSDPPPPADPPPAVAFEEPEVSTTTAPAVEPTTTTTSTTTTSTTPTTTTTTEPPREIMSIGYAIVTIDQDGLQTTVDADRLDVYVDDVLDQSIEVMDGDRQVTISLDVTDLSPGVHLVRLELFNGDRLVSTEGLPISK